MYCVLTYTTFACIYACVPIEGWGQSLLPFLRWLSLSASSFPRSLPPSLFPPSLPCFFPSFYLFLLLLSSSFETKSLAKLPPSRWSWLDIESLFVSTFLHCDYNYIPPFGFWQFNLCLHDCKVNILPAKLSSQPQSYDSIMLHIIM